MQAAVLKADGSLVVESVPAPHPEPGEVVLRVRDCGICGSDLHAAAHPWQLPPDSIMGHEFSGTIAAVGAGVSGIAEGDPVVVQSVIGCGGCDSCDAGLPNHCGRRVTIGVHADGGFAEYCAVPAANIYAVPPGVSLEAVALLQPFAIAAYALEVGGVGPGDRIGVWGDRPKVRWQNWSVFSNCAVCLWSGSCSRSCAQKPGHS